MKRYIVVILLLLLYPNQLLAYDDALSHPKITEEGIKNADLHFDLKNYLIHNIGLTAGFKANLKNHDKGRTLTVLGWLQK